MTAETFGTESRNPPADTKDKMNNTRQQIDKRIEELRQENKTYILFNDRYLLEGVEVSLLRCGKNLRYGGNRFTDYGVEPPKIIEIKDCITTSDLEKMFEEAR